MHPQQPPQQPGWNPYGPTPQDQQWGQGQWEQGQQVPGQPGQQAPYAPNYPAGAVPQQPYGQQPYSPQGAYGQFPYGQSPYGQAPYAQAPKGPSPALPILSAVVAFLLFVEWTIAVIVTIVSGQTEDVQMIGIPLIVSAIPLVLGMLQMLMRTRASRWVLLVAFVLGMPMSFLAGVALNQGGGVPLPLALGVGGVLCPAGIFLVVSPPTGRYLQAVTPKGPKPAQQHYPQQHYPQQHYPQQHYPQQHYPQQPYPQQHYPQQAPQQYPQQQYPQQHWYPYQ